MLVGWCVLDFLGDRVSSWGCLRGVAQGFRSSATLALTIWLRRTQHLYVATTAEVAAATEHYGQTGELVFPFAARGVDPFEGEPQAEDDGELDEGLLRPRDVPGPVRLGLGPGGQALLDSSSSESEEYESSTMEPSAVSESQESSEGTRGLGCDGIPGHRGSSVTDVGFGTSYQAAEGILWCTYGDNTVPIPLPGWDVSAVQTVVVGLTTGDWTEFQSMMAEGAGVEEGVELPSGSAEVPRRRFRSRLRKVWSPGRLARIVVCLVFWFFWGCLKAVAGDSDEAWGPQETQCTPGDATHALLLRPQTRDVSDPWEELGEGCDGSTAWEVSKVVLLILTWEIVKAVARAYKAQRAVFKDEGTQTLDRGIIAMPLESHVPNRSKILYSLWRAGYRFDICEYSERVRVEFEGLVGAWLARVEDGEISSASSSD